uniref:RXLR effector n=1 Tax=Hyaloperonospora arabidopsidis TaxID=272952 RepID=F6MF03_HYAAB|nr:RXLR effector [Hyaloperonospora arabidopsidis]
MRFIALTLVASTALLPRTESATEAAGASTTDQRDAAVVVHVTSDYYGSLSSRLLRSQVGPSEVPESAISAVASRIKPAKSLSGTVISDNLDILRSVHAPVSAGRYIMWPEGSIAAEIKKPVIKAEELILYLDQMTRTKLNKKRSRGVLAAMTADKESLVVQGKVANSVSSAILETPSDHPVEKLQASYDKEIVQVPATEEKMVLANRYMDGLRSHYEDGKDLFHFLKSEQFLVLAKEARRNSDFFLRLLRLNGDRHLAFSLTLLRMLGNHDQQVFATECFDLLQASITRVAENSPVSHS